MRGADQRGICLAYAAGPGDVVRTFAHWQAGRDDPHQLAMTYSGQFFDLCRQMGARGVVLSSCPRADRVADGPFYVENVPKGPMRSGIGFHVQQIEYVRRIVARAVAHGADLLIVADATGHFFPLQWFAPRRMGVVPSLHCTLWPKYHPPAGLQSVVNRLNRRLFAHRAAAILCLSRDIEKQVRRVSNHSPRPIIPFIPTYRGGALDPIAAPPEQGPFNLLFAGRMEPEKGIYHLLQMAVDLKRAGQTGIHLHLCGNGSREADLRRAAAEAGVAETFHIHGYCRRPRMLAHIARSHALIVPTTTAFGEGFNKVVVEGVLARRPVITSAVCPAIEMVSDAVLEVDPDDADGYRRAALQLASDRDLYDSKREACRALQAQFYNPARSWGRALSLAVERWTRER